MQSESKPGSAAALRIALGCVVVLACSCFTARSGDGPETSKDRLTNSQCFVYFGTYTGAKSRGIYVSRMDLQWGTLTPIALAAESPSPAFLEIDSQRRVLYAVNEINQFEGQAAGAVSAFSMDRDTGKLALLNQRSSRGSGPCHLMLDRDGRNVLVANYAGGSVAVLPVRADGSLGEASAFVQHAGHGVDPDRQEGPHAHCLALDPTGRFAFVCDLGLDRVFVYRFDARAGTLSPGEPPFASLKAGAGPRHMVFHPNGRFGYVINELNSTITVFAWDAGSGSLKELQSIATLPDGYSGRNTTAEIEVHPSGKFLYASNRGRDSIAVFAIDPAKGTLTYIEDESTAGKKPRHFGISPGGNYLLAANQDSDFVVVFQIESATGRLKPTGKPLAVPSPVCVKFFVVPK